MAHTKKSSEATKTFNTFGANFGNKINLFKKKKKPRRTVRKTTHESRCNLWQLFLALHFSGFGINFMTGCVYILLLF